MKCRMLRPACLSHSIGCWFSFRFAPMGGHILKKTVKKTKPGTICRKEKRT